MNKKPRAVPILLLYSYMLVFGGYNEEDRNKADSDRGSEEVKTIGEREYSALLPFSVGDTGQKHVQIQTSLSDILTIGTGPMELSKEYFSNRAYTFRDGKYLGYNILDASAGGDELLGRTNRKNVNDLSPTVGDAPPTNDGNRRITANNVLPLDIFEYNWYQNEELEGLSLALMFNDKTDTKPREATIDSDKAKLHGEKCACKLANYLRKTKLEIGSNTPIYIALYNTSSDDAMLSGAYFEEVYFGSKTNVEFRAINEKWALFPTSTAAKLDETNVTYFDCYKASFRGSLGQDIDMTGKGHFMGNELTDLHINVKLHTRSTDEVIAAVQLLDERLSISSSNNFKIMVVVKADDVDIATVTRNKDTSSTVAQILLH